jgi:hypothetical protein
MFTLSHPLKAGANRSLEMPKPVPVTMMALCNAEGTVEWSHGASCRFDVCRWSHALGLQAQGA